MLWRRFRVCVQLCFVWWNLNACKLGPRSKTMRIKRRSLLWVNMALIPRRLSTRKRSEWWARSWVLPENWTRKIRRKTLSRPKISNRQEQDNSHRLLISQNQWVQRPILSLMLSLSEQSNSKIRVPIYVLRIRRSKIVSPRLEVNLLSTPCAFPAVICKPMWSSSSKSPVLLTLLHRLLLGIFRSAANSYLFSENSSWDNAARSSTRSRHSHFSRCPPRKSSMICTYIWSKWTNSIWAQRELTQWMACQ